MHKDGVKYNGPRAGIKHLAPEGYLLNEEGQHALWYYLRCAHHALETVPTQITTTDDEDARTDLKRLAESIANIYGVSTEDMFKREYWERAKLEAADSKLRIKRHIQLFIDSGGQKGRYLDRDPDAHDINNTGEH